MNSYIDKIYDNEQFIPSKLGVFLNPYYLIREGISREVISNSECLKGRLLDFGCGKKPYKKLIHVDEYVGVDICKSGDCLESEYVDVYYDGKTIPFEDSYFDSIFSNLLIKFLTIRGISISLEP